MVEVLKSQKPVLFSYVALFVILICIRPIKSQAQSMTLAPDEVETLREIAEQLNKKDWNYSDPCSNGPTFWSPYTDPYHDFLDCNCSFSGNICHIESISLTGQDLDGVLPASLAKLPYLKHVDLRRNDLSGSIPREWASTKLENLYLSVNNLSGPIPGYLGNITTLRELDLESNLFSGPVPSDLGKLINMERLILRANNLTGELPVALTNLTKLQELQIGSNNFTGRIPTYFESWKDLETLEMIASGFEGPLPSSLSVLKNMTNLSIGELSGESSEFPNLSNMTKMEKLRLRSCNITGPIPEYISTMTNLHVLDLSFNRLEGTIPNSLADKRQLSTIYLTSNFLTGLPDWIKSRDTRYNIDLSYNNFSQSSVPTVCRETFNWFRGISQQNNSILSNCLDSCSEVQYSLHINCGGIQTTIGDINYEGDQASGGAATFVQATPPNWGFSSTGDFVDDGSSDNDYIANNVSTLKMKYSILYTTARLSPLLLTYYARCLANGNYTVKLHFAEIVLRDNRSYYGVGRRMFDVYIQDKLVLKDFDIRKEALGVDKEVIKVFKAAVNNTLLIRFQWAGRGTTNVPRKGKYGSLISAISVERLEPVFEPPIETVAKASKNRKLSEDSDSPDADPDVKKFITFLQVLGAIDGSLILLFVTWRVYKAVKKRNKILRKKLYFKRNGGLLLEQQLSSGEVNVEKIKLFKSKELEKSTDNYNNNRIIGQGAQGVVYKGMLADGRIVAVKKSNVVDERKLTEFINEVVILSQINHRNVVQLLGCCLETDVPVLVYEFIPNGTLSRYISEQNEEFPLTWKMRLQIATEVAGALSYLHSAAAFPIYHRDIKSTNILLDEKFRAKVADFGISRSIAIDQTHLTTAVHGTFGYLDPEYFQSSQFTDKSDVYSFGVVLVELLTGQKPICAITRGAQEEEYHRSLATKFIVSMQEDILYEILDARVRKEAKGKEIRVVSNLALRCLDLNGRNRPTMREVTMELETIQMLPKNNVPNAQYDVGVEYLENDSLGLWDVVSSSGDQSASYDCPSSSLQEHQQSTTKTWVTYWMVIMLLLSNFLQNRNREIVNS